MDKYSFKDFDHLEGHGENTVISIETYRKDAKKKNYELLAEKIKAGVILSFCEYSNRLEGKHTNSFYGSQIIIDEKGNLRAGITNLSAKKDLNKVIEYNEEALENNKKLNEAMKKKADEASKKDEQEQLTALNLKQEKFLEQMKSIYMTFNTELSFEEAYPIMKATETYTKSMLKAAYCDWTSQMIDEEKKAEKEVNTIVKTPEQIDVFAQYYNILKEKANNGGFNDKFPKFGE